MKRRFKLSESHQQSVARLAVYRELSAAAAAVMDNSHPTPTQEENDAAMMGIAHPDEQTADHGPVMMPLHEQYARLAAAAEPQRTPPPASRPAAAHTAPAAAAEHRASTTERK
jgi:hypothetical protein